MTGVHFFLYPSQVNDWEFVCALMAGPGFFAEAIHVHEPLPVTPVTHLVTSPQAPLTEVNPNPLIFLALFDDTGLKI